MARDDPEPGQTIELGFSDVDGRTVCPFSLDTIAYVEAYHTGAGPNGNYALLSLSVDGMPAGVAEDRNFDNYNLTVERRLYLASGTSISLVILCTNDRATTQSRGIRVHVEGVPS